MALHDFLTHFDNYDLETKTYTHSREAGLYAVLNSILRTVCFLKIYGYEVDKIKLLMNEYIDQRDCFGELFTIKDTKLNLNRLPDDEKSNFLEQLKYKSTGLGENPKNINLKISNQIISKFFNPTNEVVDFYKSFVSYLGGDLSKIIFVWARKTDKILENNVPSVKKYLEVLSTLDLRNNKVLIQTDDQSVIDEFTSHNLDFITIPHIPLPKNKDNAFHRNLRDVSDKSFEESYGISKINHLRQFVALSLIAQNANTVILYPGNPTTFLPLFCGSFDHFILFENELKLY